VTTVKKPPKADSLHPVDPRAAGRETALYGGPLQLHLDVIDEDPGQPRTRDNPGFSAASLGELAATIRLRGVKTPISVRDNPDAPGRYLINHGARRFRGSRLAGKATIPAFVDNDYNDVDQVIENLQRNELTAREIADFIGRELAKGLKKGAIAQSIGKSAAFVTQHAALLDLPGPVAAAFTSGRVKDVTVVNELVKTYRTLPAEVTGWLADETQDITRGAVKLLRAFVNEKLSRDDAGDEGDSTGPEAPDAARTPMLHKKSGRENNDRMRATVVRVKHKGRVAHLMLNRRPTREGFAWLKYGDNGDELEADLAQVRLVALVEG
jgi:ParB family chromosome partitioning protein